MRSSRALLVLLIGVFSLGPTMVLPPAEAHEVAAAAITLTVSDTSLDAGQRFQASGRMATRVQRPVKLQVRSGSRWSTIASTRSSKKGRYVLRATSPSAAGKVDLRSIAPARRVGDTKLRTITSRTVTVVVADRPSSLSAGTARTSYTVGESVEVSAMVLPASSRPVVLQRQDPSGSWVTVASGATSPTGTTSLTHQVSLGAFLYRLSAPAFGGFSAATSSPVSVEGSAPPAPAATRLQVVVTGLPNGQAADLLLTGPGQAPRPVTGDVVIDPATPGDWVLDVRPVKVGTDTYYGVEPAESVHVSPEGTASIVADYGVVIPETTTVAPSRSIEDVTPLGDGVFDITLSAASTTASVRAGAVQARVRRQVDHLDASAADIQGSPTCSALGTGLVCEGNVFVSGVTEAASQGLFGRVVSLADPTHLRIDANGVTLADAIPVGQTAKAGAAATVARSAEIHSGPLTCTGSATASLDAGLDLTPTLDFSARFAGGSLAEAKVVSRLTQTAHGTATLSGKGTCGIEPFDIAPPRTLSPITVQVGPVPVVFVPRVSLRASAGAQVDGTAKVGFEESAAAEAGITYSSSGGFQSQRNFQEPSVTQVGPEFDGSASADVTLTAAIDFKLYGAAGPRLAAEAALTGHAQAHASPQGAQLDWSVDAKVRGYGQFRVDVLGFQSESPELTFWGPFTKNLARDSWTWNPPSGYLPAIATSTLTDGSVGGAYAVTLKTADNREGRWSVGGGSLPPGLTLNRDNGVLSGTPSADGTYSFTAAFEDAYGSTATRDLSLRVAPRSADVLPDAFTGHPGTPDYYQQLPDSPGRAGQWSIASGSLPTGLGITSGGYLTGRPTLAGQFGFTARFEGLDGSTQDFAYRLAVVDVMLSSNCGYTPGKTAIVAGMGISERGLNTHHVRVTLNGSVEVDGVSTPSAPLGRFWPDLANATPYSVDLTIDEATYHLDAFCP